MGHLLSSRVEKGTAVINKELVKKVLAANDLGGVARDIGLEPEEECDSGLFIHVANCPVCQERRLKISKKRQSFMCFNTNCNSHGDAITLLHFAEGLTLTEAVGKLAQRAEIPLYE
tara:strand:- start:590 stop:937 length:348 start_codon:yes stop_codon:yes gene_type:complete